MKNPWLLPSLMLLVGAAGGFISGRNTSHSTETADQQLDRSTRSTQRSSEERSEGATSKRSSRTASYDEIIRMAGNSNRIQALIAFYSGLSPEQLEEEARKLDSLPMNERIMASFLLFGRWAEVDPTAAMSFSSTMGFSGMFVRPTILQSWASVDPANAAKYYAANPREFAMMGMMGGGRGPMGGQGGAAIIASEWARQDPAGALAWANTLTTEKSQALSSVVGEVAKNDPKKAAEMLAGMSGDNLGEAYRRVAESYGTSDFNEAQAWIRTLPADQQAGALASAIGGLSNKDPEAAARELAKMQDGQAKNRVFEEVVGDWARVNPTAASQMVKNQKDPDVQRDAMRQLMPTWVGQNPAAALEHAYTYEAGPVRDAALQSYVWSNQSGNPSDMVKVAESISDEGERQRSIGIATNRWMREEPDQAKSYIQQSNGLTDEAKQRILSGETMWGGRGRGRD